MDKHDGKPQHITKTYFPPKQGNYHFFRGLDAVAEAQVFKCLEFFKNNNLTFFNMSDVQIEDERQGKQRYIKITVSIKIS